MPVGKISQAELPGAGAGAPRANTQDLQTICLENKSQERNEALIQLFHAIVPAIPFSLQPILVSLI